MHTPRRLPGIRLTLALVLAGPASARAEVAFSWPGTQRWRLAALSDFALDPEGHGHGQNAWAAHRLRFRPALTSDFVDLHVELDAVTGQLFGETSAVGEAWVERRAGDPADAHDAFRRFEPRMAWLEVRTPVGVLRAGQMGSHWGLGLLAHDGEDAADAPSPFAGRLEGLHAFGDAVNGDLVDRVSFATRPLGFLPAGALSALTLALGVDRIFQDEQAAALDGDVAWQGVGALFYPGEALFAGVYAAHRVQQDDDGAELVVTALDAFARWTTPLDRLRATLRLQGEVVGLLGATDRLRPDAHAEGVDVRQLGWAVRGELAFARLHLIVGGEAGYASGDADPEDGRIASLTFDPDHRVGVLLFSEVVRRLTLRGAERAADPARAGVPPSGLAALPTDGGVRDAFYLAPGLTWRPRRWTLALGGVFAWAPEAFADPYSTFAEGGGATNPLGARTAAGDAYGTEVDAYAGRRFEVDGFRAVELGGEAALLFPGAALDGLAASGPVTRVMARADLRF